VEGVLRKGGRERAGTLKAFKGGKILWWSIQDGTGGPGSAVGVSTERDPWQQSVFFGQVLAGGGRAISSGVEELGERLRL